MSADPKEISRMRMGFEQQRKAGVNVDWFTWQIAWNDAFFDQRAAVPVAPAAAKTQTQEVTDEHKKIFARMWAADGICLLGQWQTPQATVKGDEPEHPSIALAMVEPCPFCASENVDPAGWAANDGRTGPACDECGATAETIAGWNRRAAVPQAVAPLTPEQIEAIMDQAQVFASAWSLVGGRFDFGNGLETAEQEKSNLRAMLTTPPHSTGVSDAGA